MKYLILFLLQAVLVTACGVSGSNPQEGPTLAPTADVGRALGAEVAPDQEAGAADGTGASGLPCTEGDPHPVGISIAEKFDVSYERVMSWFCAGHSFEEILIALQTGAMSDRPVDQLLVMRQTQTWDEIWADLGVVGP